MIFAEGPPPPMTGLPSTFVELAGLVFTLGAGLFTVWLGRKGMSHPPTATGQAPPPQEPSASEKPSAHVVAERIESEDGMSENLADAVADLARIVGDLQADRRTLRVEVDELRKEAKAARDDAAAAQREVEGLHEHIDDLETGVTEGRYPPFPARPTRK